MDIVRHIIEAAGGRLQPRSNRAMDPGNPPVEVLASVRARVLELIARETPLPTTLAALARGIEELKPTAIAGAAVLDRVGRRFEGAVFPSLSDTFSHAIVGIKTAPPHIGSCAAAAYQGEAVTCADVGQETRFDEEWRKLCLESGVRAIQSAPALAADGTPLGTFVLGFREPHEFNSFDADLVALGSKLAGLALERHRAQEKHELLVGELRHRIQNVFTVIYSIAHFTFRGSPEVSAIGASFNGRLAALARAHSLAASQPDLAGVIDQVLAPYRDGRLVEISGPPIALSSEATHAFILALHELATNAAKYGALSIDDGCLMIDWCIRRLGADDWFELRWVESNGPLVVPPTKTGFGSTVIERTIAQAIDATTILDYAPKGFRCTVRAPFVDRLGTLGHLNDDSQTHRES